MNSPIKKLPRLPRGLTIQKRPLLRPPIASPYASRQHQKIIYVRASTPFVSALKRVEKLLKQADRRVIQESTDKISPGSRGKISLLSGTKPSRDAEPEHITIKATGKAIDKALQIAITLKKKDEFVVKINTSSVAAIDDIKVGGSNSQHNDGDYAEANEAFPQSRVRNANMVEILVALR